MGRDFLLGFLFPTILGITLTSVFGVRYAENQGEGWGYGLSLAIGLTVANMVRMGWKYRHYKDE